MSDKPCPCEPNPFIGDVTIDSGLSRLPRQRGRFTDYRRSLLATSRTAADNALSGWQADAPDDLGLMLIDIWAYLLDIVSFYDSEVAQESYLSTTAKTVSSSRLTDLIGYKPLPATAASATLALRANGLDPVLVPKGTAFRSAGWDSEKPQVYEVSEDTWIYPERNSLTLEKVRARHFQGTLWLGPDGNTPAPGQTILFRKEGLNDAWATRVVAINRRAAVDEHRYRQMDVSNVPAFMTTDATLNDVAVYGFAQITALSPFSAVTTGSNVNDDEKRYAILDTLYPQLRVGDDIVIELTDGRVYARTISGVETVYMNAGTAPSAEVRIPATQIQFPLLAEIDSNVARVHIRPYRLAPLINPARIKLNGTDLSAYLPIVQQLEPFETTRPAPDAAIFKGAKNAAFLSPVSFEFDRATGEAKVQSDEPSLIKTELYTPVSVLSNIVKADRGETVTDEQLGVADGGRAFQGFALKKKPLTFLPGEGLTAASVPVLEVRVSGILWQRVDSFVGAGPMDEVYTVEIAPDGNATVRFGDRAIPAGKVTATYRFGAGAAKPPAGLINSLSAPVKGIDSVAWSLQPVGGRDADKASSIKENAPASMLCFGRAVSLKDYEALAHQYPGVTRASAGWAFEPHTQRAQVVVWVISEGGSVTNELGNHLTGLGDPDLPVVVSEANALGTPVTAEISIDGRYLAADVRGRVMDALTNLATGFLSPAVRGMREPLFRSQLIRVIMNIDGVTSVDALSIAGSTSTVGVTVPEGSYRRYSPLNIAVTS